LDAFSGTWPKHATMHSGVCWELTALVLHTDESDCGYARPTPSARSYGHNQGGAAGRVGKSRESLESMAKHNTWPTPNVPNGGRSVTHAEQIGNSFYHNGKKVQIGLEAAVKKWPTPVRQDAQGHGRVSPDIPSPTDHTGTSLVDAVGGSLNPMWVEWLMGWCLGWTDLKPLAMARYHSWQQQHGCCCHTD